MYIDCPFNDWLLDSSNYQWTMTPAPYSSGAYTAFPISSSGHITVYHAYTPLAVRPVVYLKSNVLITSGTGESTNPYVLSMN